jgi:hypothetical protein
MDRKQNTSLIIFFLHILLFTTNVIYAQNHTQTIRGTVTDKVSGASLPGANILIQGSNPLQGTVADSTGNFVLTKVPIGRVTLKCSYIGYKELLLSNIELTSGKELILTIEMEESVITGKEVVITANRDKSSPINPMSIVSVREFTVEETNMYAGARSDVSRMVANYAGVCGNEDSRNDIIIRGNTPSGLLWRLDDVDIPNPNHFAAMGTTGGPISILRNNLLMNSDFLTAAFPAEYGNALAGVFDLKTVSGNDQKHEFMAQIAFNGIEACAEGPISKKNRSSYIVDYRYSTLDLFSKTGVQMGTGTAVPKYQDLFFKLNFPKTAIGSLALTAYGGISRISFMDSKKDTTRDKIDFYGVEGWDIHNYSDQAVVSLSDIIRTGKKSFLKIVIASTYHNFLTKKDSVTPVSLNTVLYEHADAMECKLFSSIVYNAKINARHSIKGGLLASFNNYKLIDSIYKGNISTFFYKNDFSGLLVLYQPFISWQYKINDAWQLNTGLHLQFFKYNQSMVAEPRIGLKWQFSNNQSLSFGTGLHSQTIPVTVYFSQTKDALGNYSKPNTNLGFSKSFHAALAYNLLFKEHHHLKAEIYFQYLYHIPIDAINKNSFSLLNEGANFEVFSPDSLVNNGTGLNYGIEITFERFLSKGFYYLGTFSFYNSKYSGSDGVLRNTAFNGGYNINLLAGKEFNIKLRKHKPEKRKKTFAINLKTTFNGGQRYTPINEALSLAAQKNIYIDELAYTEKFKDYMRTDLKLAYKMNGKKVTIEWSLEITNLFNQKNVYNQTFNRKTGESYFTYQLGRMIIPQYRIYF